jgi:putative iron-dependent peroxidase
VNTPQSGIFALGTASHAYLELDAATGRTPRELVTEVSSLREPRTTMGGVNLVAGSDPSCDATPHPRRLHSSSTDSTNLWSAPTGS